MLIHVICRGNVLRSVIAEAYINALHIPETTVMSSGTVADVHRDRNAPNVPRIRELLRRHGVAEFAKPVLGDQLTQQRFDAGDLTVTAARTSPDTTAVVRRSWHSGNRGCRQLRN